MATQDLNYTLDAKDKKGPDALAKRAEIQEDYTRADVYYQTLNVRSIVQNEAYPVSIHKVDTVFIIIIWLLFQAEQLIPGIGGALSLYLGIAIVMAFELLELLFDLILAIFQHKGKST